MKKITGVLKAKGFEDCNFEFYVDDNMTENKLRWKSTNVLVLVWTGRKKTNY